MQDVSNKRDSLSSVYEVCQRASQKYFYIVGTEERINWNVHKAFEEATVVLGKGGFGMVKEACFPFCQLPDDAPYKPEAKVGPVAIKQVLLKKMLPMEIEMLKAMALDKSGVPFFGCQVDPNKMFILIVQERLEKSLADDEGYRYLRSMNRFDRFQVYRSMVNQLCAMNYLGYIHNDIKPNNMMFGEKAEKVYLIDFGLASVRGGKMECAGTEFFLSPGKCQSFTRGGRLVDDLYSLVVTIALLESSNNNEVFMDRDTKQIDMGCRWAHTFRCNENIRTNINALFKKLGFPAPRGKPGDYVDNINLMGVFDMALEYKNFDLKPLEVMYIAGNFGEDMYETFGYEEEHAAKPTWLDREPPVCDHLLPGQAPTPSPIKRAATIQRIRV